MFQGAWDLSTVAKLANSHVWCKKRYRAAWPRRADDDSGDNGTADDNPAG